MVKNYDAYTILTARALFNWRTVYIIYGDKQKLENTVKHPMTDHLNLII